MLNIERFIAGEYTPVTRDIINVIKATYCQLQAFMGMTQTQDQTTL